MKQNGTNIGWEVNGKYTTKTKTVFALTTLQFPNEVEWCDTFEDWQVDEIVEQMELIGFKNVSRSSVAMYMNALIGKPFQRIQQNKSFQKEINAFRKGQSFDIVKF
jgi:hypothetical protein